MSLAITAAARLTEQIAPVLLNGGSDEEINRPGLAAYDAEQPASIHCGIEPCPGAKDLAERSLRKNRTHTPRRSIRTPPGALAEPVGVRTRRRCENVRSVPL